jgi:hypothetical protein
MMAELVARSPSFDLGYPKIPGRDLEGIPNANDPVMKERLRQRLLRNPDGGQELPGFLQKAEGPGGLGPVAMDLLYDGAQDGDYSNMPVIPDAVGDERERDAQLEEYRLRAFPSSGMTAPLLYS